MPCRGGTSSGRRQPGADGVEHLRDALVAQGRAAQEGDEPPAQGGPANRSAHRRAVEVRVLEERGGRAVVHVGERRQELAAGLLPLARDPLRHHERPRIVVVGEGDGPALHQVLEPGEVDARAHRALHRRAAVVGEVAPHRAEGLLEVGADPVHLVGERDARDPVAVGLPPHRLALRLDPVHRVEDHHRAVEDAQAPLHLHREVHVPRGVDEVELVAAPLEGAHRRGDGDPALALQLHPVHHGQAVVDLPHLVGAAGREEEALRERGLPGVDVGHDPDVADRPDPADRGRLPCCVRGHGRRVYPSRHGAGPARWTE